MYLYYPVILIGISVVLLFNPTKTFYFRTRMWLLYSLACILVPTRNIVINKHLVALVTRWRISRRKARILSG
jgi:hypothetical protein